MGRIWNRVLWVPSGAWAHEPAASRTCCVRSTAELLIEWRSGEVVPTHDNNSRTVNLDPTIPSRAAQQFVQPGGCLVLQGLRSRLPKLTMKSFRTELALLSRWSCTPAPAASPNDHEPSYGELSPRRVCRSRSELELQRYVTIGSRSPNFQMSAQGIRERKPGA